MRTALADDADPEPPPIVVLVHADGTGEITAEGTVHQVKGEDVPGARQQVVTWISRQIAAPLGHPVRVETTDPAGSWEIMVHPDGSVRPVGLPDREHRHPGPSLSPAPGTLLPGASRTLDLPEDLPASAAWRTARARNDKPRDRPSIVRVIRAVRRAGQR